MVNTYILRTCITRQYRSCLRGIPNPVSSAMLSLTRVTKSFFLALGTTQISTFFCSYFFCLIAINRVVGKFLVLKADSPVYSLRPAVPNSLPRYLRLHDIRSVDHSHTLAHNPVVTTTTSTPPPLPPPTPPPPPLPPPLLPPPTSQLYHACRIQLLRNPRPWRGHSRRFGRCRR